MKPLCFQDDGDDYNHGGSNFIFLFAVSIFVAVGRLWRLHDSFMQVITQLHVRLDGAELEPASHRLAHR